MNDEKKVLVVEPLIKSDTFLDYMHNLVRDTLNENGILFLTIKKDGFYFIVDLKNRKEMVSTMDLLSKISGISCIFVAKCLVIDFDVLSKTVTRIGKEILLPNERFNITIRTSKMGNSEDNDDFLFFKKDLEFLMISELSSLSPDTKYVTNEYEADKNLYVLIGSDFAYVSILLTKNKETIPFKFFRETVICPIYDDYSFLSLISILNNGFFPIPFVFYDGKSNLRQTLKTFDKVIKRYPINNIAITLIDITHLYSHIDESLWKYGFNSNQSKGVMMRKLVIDETIVAFLLRIGAESNFICLPFLPFLHPLWFFKKNMIMAFESGKIPLTPFLFNYEIKNHLRDFCGFNGNTYDEKNSRFYPLYLDVTQRDFELALQKTKTNNSNVFSLGETRKINLDLRKDDILDTLNSV
jgi:hypothetical protein